MVRYCDRHISSVGRPDGLQVYILVDGVRRAIASETGLLETAEWRGNGRSIETVDPHGAGAQGGGDAMCGIDVRSPYRGGETINAVVRHDERVRFLTEARHRKHGPENLLA